VNDVTFKQTERVTTMGDPDLLVFAFPGLLTSLRNPHSAIAFVPL